MVRRTIAGLWLLSTPVLAQAPAASGQEPDIGGLLSGKKPCDGETKPAAPATPPAPATGQAPASGAAQAKAEPTPQVDPKAVDFGAPAAKPAEKPKSLGAVGGMENCK